MASQFGYAAPVTGCSPPFDRAVCARPGCARRTPFSLAITAYRPGINLGDCCVPGLSRERFRVGRRIGAAQARVERILARTDDEQEDAAAQHRELESAFVEEVPHPALLRVERGGSPQQ